MPISFYDASIASYLQTLHAVSGFLDKGLAYCSENGIDPNELIEARIHADMLPFRYQVQAVAHHSLGAINGIMNGLFHPPSNLPQANYQELQQLITETQKVLAGFTRETINSYEHADLLFEIGKTKMPFTAQDFLLSFSLPNFYFHATTAYDILRAKGAPLGKRDYIGSLRLKH